MVYVMMTVSIIVGICISTGWLVNDNESLIMASGTYIGPIAWGILLIVFAGLSLIGMTTHRMRYVAVGAFACFMLWLMATLNLLTNNHYYAVIVWGLFHMLFQGYVYLTASLGILERASLTDDEQ